MRVEASKKQRKAIRAYVQWVATEKRGRQAA